MQELRKLVWSSLGVLVKTRTETHRGHTLGPYSWRVLRVSIDLDVERAARSRARATADSRGVVCTLARGVAGRTEQELRGTIRC